MSKSGLLKFLGLALLVILSVVVYRLLGTTIKPVVENKVQQIGLTANEAAAVGPLPGEVGLYAEEWACQQALPTPGYYSSLNGAEISNAERTGRFPCATFTGDFSGPNEVYAWRSEGEYPGISYINNRRPGELYIVGGEYPTKGHPKPVGPYLAKVNAASGKEIWRTYVDNPNASGRWIGNANLNILPDGNIPLAWSNQIVLIDGDTGEILNHGTLPGGPTKAENVNFKHLTIAPDGTLIMKDQTRPDGCTGQGTVAIIVCADQGMPLTPSNLVAVDPNTLEVLDQLPLPESAPSPHIITTYNGKITVYIGGNESLYRAFWDPDTKKLSLDESWVVKPMQPGQTAATAPSIIGDWVTVQLNGLFSEKKASSVVSINQSDATNTHVIFPFGELAPGGISFAPPKGTTDPENDMVFSADMGMKKVAGIKIDRATGEMTVKYVLDNVTNTFQPLFGPPDKRVLVLTNIRFNAPNEPMKVALFTENYKEQLTWHDAATGRLLAESDFFEPLTINSLTPPGFGGRVYFPTAVGSAFYVLQPMPARPSN